MLDIADLPQPSEAFDWVQAAPGPALVCRPLAAVAPHLFTTRHWRLGSEANGLDSHPGWDDVARALDVDAPRLVRVRQVHGASVAIAGRAVGALVEADIVVSADPALGLAIQAADCVPLLIADRRTGAVAAAHAGWRGLAAGVPAAAVGSLSREFASRSADLVAAIGPAVGACCYEVGDEIRARFAAGGFNGEQLDRWFLPGPAALRGNPSMRGIRGPRRGRWFFDSWAAAREQLMIVGVSASQIFAAGLCTASHPTVLCSYRRDGQAAGRLAGAIRSAPPRP